MFRLGLTGGIGSGKSTVADMLVACGATLIDADAIARTCTLPGGAAIPAIASQFGADFLTKDGALDRQRMRDHAFDDPSARSLLEAIIHPIVKQEIRRAADSAGNSACVVFDIPLLVESSLRWRHQLDWILVVDCAESTQIDRVRARNGWTSEQVSRVIRLQSGRAHRLAAADWVIHNDGVDIQALQCQVQQLALRLGL